MAKVFIVAGGPSLNGFDFRTLRKHDCIAVNRSIFDVPDAKYFVTIDYTFLRKMNRDKFIRTKATKIFVANFGMNQLVEKNGQITCKKTRMIYDLSLFDVVIKSRRIDGIGFEWHDFRNGNCSGYCALQLAILLGYTEIYLMGIDLTTDGAKTHYHQGYGQKLQKVTAALANYYGYFSGGIPAILNKNIKVYSCSKISRLNQLLPFLPAQEAL